MIILGWTFEVFTPITILQPMDATLVFTASRQ